MSTQSRSWVQVLTLGGRSSLDLTLVVLLVAATMLSVFLDAPVIVRTPLALLLVFFTSGYVATLALFPTGTPTSTVSDHRDVIDDGISTMDRFVLSVATSLVVVIGVGIGIDLSPVLVSTESILDALALVILVTIPIAHYRRQQLTADRRFSLLERLSSMGPRNSTGRPGIDLLRIALVVSLLFAGGAVAFSVGASTGGGEITEFYFAGEQGGDAAYPINMTTGERETIPLAVGNHEGKTVRYGITGHLERLERRNGSTVAVESRRLGNRTMTIPAGETRSISTSLIPTAAGDYRLSYTLRKGGGADTDDPYREIHLRINVDDATTDE